MIMEKSYICYKTPNILYCFSSSKEYNFRRMIDQISDMKEHILKNISRNHDYIITTDCDFMLKSYILNPPKGYDTFYHISGDTVRMDDLYHLRVEVFTEMNRRSNQFYGDIINFYYCDNTPAVKMYMELMKDHITTFKIEGDINA